MIRPTGKETMDAGKIVYYTGRFQVRIHSMPLRATGEQWEVRSQRGKSCGQGPFSCFPCEGIGEAGKTGLGLTKLNHSRTLEHWGCPQLSHTWPCSD